MTPTLILASGNPGKLAELQALLPGFVCVSQRTLGIPEAEETAVTFIENALIKARHASHLGHHPALADDSGLVVPALDGAPGIRSARFAGEAARDAENIRLLLQRMDNLDARERHAFFYCAIVLVQHPEDPTPVIATGLLPGQITREQQGTNGFGYDPVFWLPAQGCTMAELSAEAKNTISHRALALANLRKQLESGSKA